MPEGSSNRLAIPVGMAMHPRGKSVVMRPRKTIVGFDSVDGGLTAGFVATTTFDAGLLLRL